MSRVGSDAELGGTVPLCVGSTLSSLRPPFGRCIGGPRAPKAEEGSPGSPLTEAFWGRWWCWLPVDDLGRPPIPPRAGTRPNRQVSDAPSRESTLQTSITTAGATRRCEVQCNAGPSNIAVSRRSWGARLLLMAKAAVRRESRPGQSS